MVEAVHYLSVLNPGPLIIARVPWPMPRWREDVVRGLTPVMQMHGLRQKDISGIMSLTVFSPGCSEEERRADPKGVESDAKFLVALRAAYAGDPKVLPKFWLYAWTGNGLRFQLVRPGA